MDQVEILDEVQSFRQKLSECITDGLDLYLSRIETEYGGLLCWPLQEDEETMFKDIVKEFGRINLMDLDDLDHGGLVDVISETYSQMKEHRVTFGILKNLSIKNGRYSGVLCIIPYNFNLTDKIDDFGPIKDPVSIIV